MLILRIRGWLTVAILIGFVVAGGDGVLADDAANPGAAFATEFDRGDPSAGLKGLDAVNANVI